MLKFSYGGAANDPTHPDSPLPPRHTGDILFRLIRKFGAGKGLRLFGFVLSLAEEGGIETILDRQRFWEYTQDLKSCGLAPKNIKPLELGSWTRAWFLAGFDAGMLAGRLAKPTPGGKGKTRPAG